MNRILSISTLSFLLAGSSATVFAANANDRALHGDNANRAVASFRNMDQQIADISDAAFIMNRQAEEVPDAEEYQASRLVELTSEVNRVGHELATMQDLSTGLPEWEADALNQVVPLMSDAAHRLTDAIHEFSSGCMALRFNGYTDQTALIAKDTEKAATLIKKDITSEKAREKKDILIVASNPS